MGYYMVVRYFSFVKFQRFHLIETNRFFIFFLLLLGQIQQKTEVNETDDRKVEKTGKKKGSKRKVENPKHWKQMHFALRVIEGHHHPLCAVDFNQDIIISGGFVILYLLSFLIWLLRKIEIICVDKDLWKET